MESSERERIAEAWMAMQRNWWAYDRVDTIIEGSPSDAWELVRELIDRADSSKWRHRTPTCGRSLVVAWSSRAGRGARN